MRAAIIATAQSIFPVLVLAGLNVSNEMVAAIMLVITNVVTLVALIFPAPQVLIQQQPEPDVEALNILRPTESRSVIKP